MLVSENPLFLSKEASPTTEMVQTSSGVSRYTYSQFLFLVLFASPSIVFEPLPSMNLGFAPGVTYPLWLPAVAPFDLLLMPLIFGIVQSRMRRPTVKVLTGILIMHLVALAIQYVNGYGIEFYDGALTGLRYALLSFLIFEVVRSKFPWAISVLAVICCTLVLVSLLAVVLNGYQGVFGGRINLLGLGANVSSDLLIIVLLLTFYSHKRGFLRVNYLLAMTVAATIFVPLTGSRRALLYLALSLAYISLHTRFLRRPGFYIGGVLLVFVAITQPAITELVARGVERMSSSLSKIVEGEFNDGRVQMYAGALQVVANNPWGVGLSDWAIQLELVKAGAWGSHTHNLFIQLYLKFGPFSILLFFLIYRWIRIAIRGGGGVLILVMVASSLSGYGFWNLKFFSIYVFTVVTFSHFAGLKGDQLAMRAPFGLKN